MAHRKLFAVALTLFFFAFGSATVAAAASSAANSKVSGRRCESIKNYTQCTAHPGCSWCSQYPNSAYYGGGCYDAAKYECCIAYEEECYTPVLCPSAVSKCCAPWFGCSYSGQPVCCGLNETCSPGRHDATCCKPGTSPCFNSDFSTCCDIGATCCQGNGRIVEYPWCCPAGSTCPPENGTSTGCVPSP